MDLMPVLLVVPLVKVSLPIQYALLNHTTQCSSILRLEEKDLERRSRGTQYGMLHTRHERLE